uniref:Putative udp-galactose transporter related protein n=1 Tax=Lutzomyia longipalpis TaxID=7200 RepID=A0A1B0CH13_LUTLO
MSDKPKTRFLIYALGIFFCYFVFGILQEKITRGRYGDEVNEDGSRGERFTFALALVGVQCVVNWAFAKGMLLVWQQKKDETHPGYYASCSLTYLLAMVGSNMALRWVPYPTQVVGKAAKPIPVMILAVLIGRKSYPLSRYLCVLTIVLGVVLFMYKDGKSSAVDEEGTGLGELLLILSLAMDGLTGAIQERMRASSAPSAQHMMLAMNGWSSAMVAIPLVISGEALSFIQFTINHPILIWHLTTLALTGALGQLFIFLMDLFSNKNLDLKITMRKIKSCPRAPVRAQWKMPSLWLWSFGLFCGHDNKKILHGTVLCADLRQSPHPKAMGWSYSRLLGPLQYLCVLTIVLGVVLFMYKDGKSSAVDEEGTGLGELLLILSLAMDGLTGAIQERMRASSAPSAQHMMLAMNGWSSAMVAIPLVISGEALSFIQFTINHPILIWHLTTLALTGALGQLFIFLMVSGFGPLACSVVTTTRKFFTVLFSVLIFGNPLIPRQWAGAILVFLGLFSDIFINKKPPAPPQATKKPLMKEEH